MRQVLSLVESVAPCILWLDEAEKEMAGGHSSSHSDAGTTSRVIGIFSTWMQETKAQVCLAMTANGVDTLPIELINRADERFFFDLPTRDERMEVLKIHLRKQHQDPAKFDLAMLSDAADRMVGREIEQAINAAMIDSYNAKKVSLDEAILARNLARKPRIYKTMQDEMNKIINWVGHDPEQNDGIRARYASPRGANPLKVHGP
jgi:SpoVK/Ycf46/Vps4 family AAA+-type ATPase